MTNQISSRLREKDVPLMQSGAFQDTRAVIREAAAHIEDQDDTIKALEADRDHLLRIYDGVKAISQYAADTLSGPSEPEKPNAEWYRVGVVEIRQRARRLLWGNTWDAPIDEWSKRWGEEMDATVVTAKEPT